MLSDVSSALCLRRGDSSVHRAPSWLVVLVAALPPPNHRQSHHPTTSSQSHVHVLREVTLIGPVRVTGPSLDQSVIAQGGQRSAV